MERIDLAGAWRLRKSDEEQTIRAAQAFFNAGYGTPILIGRAERIEATMAALGLTGDLRSTHLVNACYDEAKKLPRWVPEEKIPAAAVSTSNSGERVGLFPRFMSISLVSSARACSRSPGEAAKGSGVRVFPSSPPSASPFPQSRWGRPCRWHATPVAVSR